MEDLLALGRQSMQISEFETSEGDVVRPYLIKKKKCLKRSKSHLVIGDGGNKHLHGAGQQDPPRWDQR